MEPRLLKRLATNNHQHLSNTVAMDRADDHLLRIPQAGQVVFTQTKVVAYLVQNRNSHLVEKTFASPLGHTHDRAPKDH